LPIGISAASPEPVHAACGHKNNGKPKNAPEGSAPQKRPALIARLASEQGPPVPGGSGYSDEQK